MMSHSIVFKTLLLFIYLTVQCDAATQQFAVYTSMGFDSSTSSSFTTINAVSDSVCAFMCNNAGTTSCVAAEYNKVTQKCIMMTSSCKLMQLISSSNSITYALPSVVNTVPRANVFLPLSSSCGQSQTDNYGVNKITSSNISITGGLSTYNFQSSGILFNVALFNNNPPNFPPTYFLTLQSSSPTFAFNIFANSFTVSFSTVTLQYMVNNVWTWYSDQPLLEFLGATTGQICFAWRFSNNANAIYFSYVTKCNPGISYNYISSNNVPTTGTAHYTAVYNAGSSSLTVYINGFFSSVTSFTNVPPAVNITRLKIGGSDSQNWFNGNYNGYYGAIGCVQLFNTALSDMQVARLYDFCTNNSPKLVV